MSFIYTGAPDECSYCARHGRIEKHEVCPYATQAQIEKDRQVLAYAELLAANAVDPLWQELGEQAVQQIRMDI